MQYLLGIHMVTHPELKAKFCYLPTVPTLIDGMITGKDTLEMAVFMTIGQEKSASQPQTEVHRFSMDVHLCRSGLTKTAPPAPDSYAGSGRRFCRVIGWFAYSSDHA